MTCVRYSKVFVVCFLLLLSCGLSAGKIFEVDFDEKNPAPLKSPAVLTDGLRGHGALVSPSSPLVFDSLKRIDPNQGTLSFWVKPVDWSQQSVKQWFPLFWLGAERCRGASYYLLLDTRAFLPSLSLFSQLSGKEIAARYEFQGDMKTKVFQRGEWTHVALTWNLWQFQIFLNGKPYATGGYNLPINRVSLPREFHLWFGNHQFWSEELNYSTVFDDIAIYNESLEAGQIREIYDIGMPFTPQKQVRHSLPVPVKSREIVADGKIDDSEWGDATRFPLNKRFFTGKLAGYEAWGMIKYDQENLYVACEAAKVGNQRMPGKGFDKRVFSGDNFELTLRSPGYFDDRAAFFQMAVAPDGAWIVNNYGQWQKYDGIKHAAVVNGDKWSVEIAIPWSIMPEAPKAGSVWLGQFGLHVPSDVEVVSVQDQILSWSHGYDSFPARYMLMYRTPRAMGELRFQEDGTNCRVESLGDVDSGKLNVDITAGKPQDLTVSIDGEKENILSVSEKDSIDLKSVKQISYVGNGTLNISAGKGEPAFVYQANISIRNPISIKHEIWSNTNTIVMSLNSNGLPASWLEKIRKSGIPAVISLKSADGQTYAERKIMLKAVAQQEKLVYQALPPGIYRLEVAASSDGKSVMSAVEFERPSEEFLAADYAPSRDVPEPWTPVEAAGDDVFRVWNREYHFAANGLPSRFVSGGRDVLAAPVKLSVKYNGKVFSFEKAVVPAKLREHSPDRIVHEGTVAAAGGAYLLDWVRTVEFDGFVYYEVSLRGAAFPFSLEELSLDFSVEKDCSRYLQTPKFNVDWSKNGKVELLPSNYYWFTGLVNGLDFMTPDDGNWVYGGKPVRFERNAADGRADASFRLIDRRVSVDKALTYRFGFMATPVKPLRSDWRNINTQSWGGAKYQNLQYHLGYNDKVELLQFPNIILLSDVSNPENARRAIENSWHSKRIKIVPFTGHCFMPDNNPFYDYYGTVWRQTMDGRPTGKSYGSSWQGKEFYMCSPVCPRSTYSDFLRWCTVNLMRKYKFDGLYLDGGQALQCDNRVHGCGFTDAFGRKISVWTDLACRNSYRQLALAIHKTDPQGILWVHAAANNAPHIHSTVDVLFPGEDLMPHVPDNPLTYTDLVPLEQWQSSYYLAQQLGTASVFLGMSQKVLEPIGSPPKNPDISTPLLTMCWLHDVHLFGNFIYNKTIEKYWEIKNTSGIVRPDTIFTGYWFPGPRIGSTDKQVLVSYYSWPDSKRLVVIVGNPSKEARKTGLTWAEDWKPSGGAVDLYTGESVDTNSLTLPPRSFKVLEMKIQ